MRLAPVLLVLACGPALAQIGYAGGGPAGPSLRWTLGVQKVQPSLSVRAEGSRDGRATLADSEADLGLGREGSPLGAFLEYQGEGQAFQVAYDSARYAGDRVLPRPILLDGVGYLAGTPLQSTAKVQVLEGMWTYKLVRRSDAWVGFDLGAQLLRADLTALAAGSAQAQKARPSWFVPQLGLTGWSSGADGLLESRVYARYFTYKGASLLRYGVDARAYFYPGFGLRAFYEDTRIRIPSGSLRQDLDLHADRRLAGLGLVVRF